MCALRPRRSREFRIIVSSVKGEGESIQSVPMVASLKAGSRRTKRARKPSGQYHHGDLHQALIAAALSEIEASGADSISLAALAKSLAVSQAAPYRHFADRDALLQAIAEEGFHLF